MSNDTGVRSALTDYGFLFGAAEVMRVHSDGVKGYVIMSLKTPRAELQISVTKTGKVRVFDHKNGGELQQPHKSIGGEDV